MAESESTDADQLEKNLISLSQCEKDMGVAEKDAELYRIKKTQPVYEKRRAILKEIPNFWYIVLAENDEFAEYIRVEDLKYLESINDIYVNYYSREEGDAYQEKEFSVTFSFKGDEEDQLIEKQEVTKAFREIVEEGEEKLVSEPVSIVWPEDLKSIEPENVKASKTSSELTTEEKKLYREGMKSLFAWFSWTGRKPGKEFRNGEDFTRLIVEDIFPYAVKYYTEALASNDEELSEDSSEGEELDISDDESASNKRKAVDPNHSGQKKAKAE